MPTSKNFAVYLHAKMKSILYIAKILKTCYFEYSENA